MRIQTYRDEHRARHFDLVGKGDRPKSFDLVSLFMSGLVTVGAVVALSLPFASHASNWSQWVH